MLKKLSPETVVFAFYFLLLLRLIGILNDFYSNGISRLNGTGELPFAWLSFHWLVGFEHIYSISCMIFLILSAPFLRLQIVRVLWAFLAFLVIGLEFAIDPGHPNFLFVWLSLILALKPSKKGFSQDEQDWSPTVYACQLQILLIYSLAGYWKLASIFQGFFDENLASGVSFFAYIVATEYIHSSTVTQFASLLMEYPVVTACLSMGVFLFQALSLPVIFAPSLYPLWGILIALFHVASLIGLGIIFIPFVVLSLLFLTFAEDIQR